MIRVFLRITLLTILMPSIIFNCHNNKEMKKEALGSITVTGFAEDAKSGATIQSADRIYFLEGIESWDKDLIGKKIKVSGILIKESYTVEDLKDEKGRWKQGSIGDKYIISKPVWQ